MLIPFDYLFKKYNIDAKGVLHVGASSGQEIESYYANGIERSVWIEAIPSVYLELSRNIKKYPNTIALLACISDTDGKPVKFNIANNDGQSSSIFEFGTHSVEHPTVKFIDKVNMQTYRIDTLLNFGKVTWTDYTFLNIDLQGAELLALKGMGKYLGGFKYAYIEVNEKELYKGCPLVGEIDEYLFDFGFVRKETTMTGAGWGDAFYLRENFV